MESEGRTPSGVLESLRQHLPVLTLPTIIAEVLHWATAGHSCFAKLLARLNLPPSRSSPLNLIPPPPDEHPTAGTPKPGANQQLAATCA